MVFVAHMSLLTTPFHLEPHQEDGGAMVDEAADEVDGDGLTRLHGTRPARLALGHRSLAARVPLK